MIEKYAKAKILKANRSKRGQLKNLALYGVEYKKTMGYSMCEFTYRFDMFKAIFFLSMINIPYVPELEKSIKALNDMEQKT
ncbi:MAG TPA: hypothetical protein VJ946_10070 [Bacteroidales bacterium]|nr:hypothetical protein [Bacteroidales bacterium]